MVLSLTDAEVTEPAQHAMTIERHYGRPMDIEWARDGRDGQLYILQARPETVKSRQAAGRVQRYKLTNGGPVLVEGRAIGQKVGSGAIRVLASVEDMHTFTPGDVLVADMTDPDWEPIMKRASAIVTNRVAGHAMPPSSRESSVFQRSLGTGSATRELANGREVTVSCSEGDTGYVYEGSSTSSSRRPSSTPCPMCRSNS